MILIKRDAETVVLYVTNRATSSSFELYFNIKIFGLKPGSYCSFTSESETKKGGLVDDRPFPC